MIKKILVLLFIINSLSFGSCFKYYKEASIESCVKKLNELSKNYKILSYKIVPAETGGRDYRYIDHFNMIIEVEELAKGDK